MNRFMSFWARVTLCAVTMGTTAVYGDGLRPLLMPGKSSLFQRVLAAPGSNIATAPGTDAGSKPTTPFMIYYVYERRSTVGEEWLQIGSDAHGTLLGWVQAKQVIPWNQALTVSFKDPRNQDRVLLFRDRDALKQLAEKHDTEAYTKLYQQTIAGQADANSPVVAVQPAAPIDFQKNFYLIPIKRHEDVYLGSAKARLLQVASVAAGPKGAASGTSPAPSAPVATQQPNTFKSGIVFVVDTTQSMRPYIEKTREVVHKVYEAINSAGVKDKVSFGLTAFRDDLSTSPQSEYLSRDVVTLAEGMSEAQFFTKVDDVKASDLSNNGFPEDAYAGVKSALENNDWSPYTGRFIVVVTDASARLGDDPLSSTHMNSKELQKLAQDKGVAVWVMHLKTPRGKADHAIAKNQYKVLSNYPGIGDFYYPVRLGAVTDFGDALLSLTSQITRQVQAISQGTSLATIEPTPVSKAHKSTDDADSLASMQEKVAKLGYALQMRYLQSKQGEAPPTVFDAWLIDKDFRQPNLSSIDVRVLVTRDQLSDLRNGLQQVLELAEEGVLSPQNFLNELKSMAATLSRETGASLKEGHDTNLADLGYMQEYMEDLPYTSEVMGMSLDDWQVWSPQQQLEFVHRLEGKVTFYQALHDHTDLWLAPAGGTISGDSLYPIPLEMLP